MNKEDLLILWWSTRPRTTRCLVQPVTLLYRHAQIFGDNLPNTDLFHIQLTCNHLNRQPTITSLHPFYRLNVDHSFACWRPPTPGVIVLLLVSLFEPLVPLKTHNCDMVLSTYICWRISSACDVRFHNWTKYCGFVRWSMFVVRSPGLNDRKKDEV